VSDIIGEEVGVCIGCGTCYAICEEASD